MKFIQHLPGFIQHTEDDLVVVEVQTTEELLKVEYIDRWTSRYGFLHFAASDEYLMAICESGYWVVGRILDGSKLDLPEWIHEEKAK